MLDTKQLFNICGILLGVAVVAMIFSELNTALADIRQALHASVNQIQWIINIYGVIICSTMVVIGRMADRYGQKKIYLLGLFLLAGSMFISAISPNANVIIFSQALTGLAGAMILPVSQALTVNAFGSADRSKAIGLWAANAGLALAAGPLVAGVVIHLLGWRWVFFCNVIITVISFITVLTLTAESKSKATNDSLNLFGSFLLIVTIASIVLVISEGQSLSTSVNILLYSIFVIGFVWFIWHEKNAKTPIIQEQLFKSKTFLLAALCIFCLLFAVWSIMFLMPLFLQEFFSYSALITGYYMLGITLPLAVLSITAGNWYKRFGPKKLIFLGFITIVVSLALQMLFRSSPNVTLIIVATVCFGIGWGLVWGLVTTLAISTVDSDQAAVASGSFITVQEIGGTVGLAATASVFRETNTSLLHSYHYSMWLLLGVIAFGCLMSLALPNMIKKHFNYTGD
ncbi:MAG: MFS transporter [Pseudomonadota bacterium]